MKWRNVILKISRIFFKKKTKYILISIQRSGTTLLTEYLQSHSDINMSYELFKPDTEGYNAEKNKQYVSCDATINDYLDDFYREGLVGHKACGFKLMLDQLEKNPDILEYIKKNKIKCIYLERENILETAISRLAARKRKIYHIKQTKQLEAIEIDVNELVDELTTIEKDLDSLHTLINRFDSLTITYEELIEKKQGTMKKIFSFLDLSLKHDIYSKVKKINSKDLSETVSNFNQIHAHLSKMEYRKYLPVNYFNDKHRCMFIHIPKNAGSSIEQALYNTKGKVTHITAIEIYSRDKRLFDQYFRFAFTRNPYDRFVSAYEYLRQGGRNKFDKAWAETHILLYGSFEDFVLSLQDSKIREKVCNWIHFKPQYTFVCDANKEVIVDFIGQYEDLNNDFETIRKKLKIDIKLPHTNRTKERKKYQNYYNKETTKIVDDIYKDDFLLFKYERSLQYMKKKLLILVFANYNYLPVLENWLEAMNILGIKNIVVISLDKEIHNHLSKQNIRSSYRACELDLNKLWIHRVKICLEFMEQGYDIIHSDADAVWLKDPLEYLSNIKQDMIFSQGTFWPKDVHTEWGFVLCCGFFYIKNNASTLAFMNDLYKRVKEDKDDQVSCNRLLMQSNIKWNVSNPYILKYRDVEFVCSEQLMIGTSKNLTIAVLPHSKFQRIHEKDKIAYIKHIISEKNSDSIMNILKETGCLFIENKENK